MMRSITHASRVACLVLLTALLSACNGSDTDTPATNEATGQLNEELTRASAGVKFIQGVPLNIDAAPTVLTVRAYGVLAGDVGPIMQVLVDGVLVGTTEVRATDPADYRFAVPAMKAGAKVDVVYTNDGVASGVDRNLFVTQLMAGNTFTLPNSAGAVLDRGVGAAALDGQNVVPGQAFIPWHAALRITWPEPNLTEQITVRASGNLVDGTGPIMSVRVDGVTVGSVEVRSTEPTDLVFAVPTLNAGSRIDVAHTNYTGTSVTGRNLNVHYLRAGNTVLLPTTSGTVFDLGNGLAAFDGANVLPGQTGLNANGALRGRWPATNMTDTLTVRASGKPAGSTAPLMQVRVDGVVLGSAEVRSTAPADFNFPSLPIKPGSQVEVIFTNPGSSDTETRSLNVAYAISGNTYLLASTGGFRGIWPEPNLTDTLTVRAKGTLAGNVGPIMQVLIDGVMVGSTEVRSTDFADYSFAAPPMRPGRKVDVVYTNDAVISGVDRNLFVAYLIAGNTSLLPGAAGNVFDRGTGTAAFDGADVVPGTATLAWSGALRTNWPQPNITSFVTVRASGTLAANIGPVMRLWVDGVAVSSVEVRATTPTDYSLPAPLLKPGSKINVTFENPELAAGVQRQLNLAYLMAGTSVLKTTASGATYSAGNLQASWPAANLTDILTVRAYGVLAGDVGPIMQVLVDGVLVGTTEVRATDPADYRFAVPAMKAGAKVDVVYTNDGVASGVDRNLFVTQLMAGNTFTLPNSAGAVLDRGVGAAALDGQNVVPGQAFIPWHAALRITWPEPNLTEQITVRASGNLVDGTGPIMSVRVDGVTVGSVEVRSTEPTDLVFAVPTLNAGSRIDVAHTNYTGTSVTGRNLNVHYLRAGNTVLLPTTSGTVFDLGNGLAAFDGANVLPGQTGLNANGALRGRWPATNMTDTLTVRASGKPAGSTAPLMQVRVDGVVLGSAEVRSTAPADFNFPSLPIKPGSQVEVIFTNPGSSDTETRSLNVAYAISGNTYLLASTGGLRGIWPEPNLTDTLTVRAKGTLAGNVGPIMQVLIDGVMVGSTEVRSTDFADYSFAAPPMRPGRKVDVVYTNDAVISGVDRNLFVAYLIAGNTSLLPGAAGNVFDRGTGTAAFDGADVVPGTATLAWSGALRTNWPQPNITSFVTVRASGTLAANIGPVMRLWVDGVAVSSVEVRATTPTDYSLPAPLLKPGSKLELQYINDEVIDGIDRNLKVEYFRADNTYVSPTMVGVLYDLGSGNSAFDNIDTLPGQGILGLNGALRLTWPAPNLVDSITIRASASTAGNIGALMQVRVDGVILGTIEVRSSVALDYVLSAPRLSVGNRLDIAFLNDEVIAGQDRNLYIQYVKAQGRTLVPTSSTVQFDAGSGEAAFDGIGTTATQGAITNNGALRFVVPSAPEIGSNQSLRYAASRFLQSATFGPSNSDIENLAGKSFSTWIDEQVAIPYSPDYTNYIQAWFNKGSNYRPQGALYSPSWVSERFWACAAGSPDALRKRVAFALHQIFVISQSDSSLYGHARTYAAYLDTLNQLAFGNFRTLLEEVALSPAMGLYLSHMRNRPEDPATGRMPDENFAREVMQLFTIGLHELNIDGTSKVDNQGQPVETYNNDDVMAMAKVFTGWSWAFPDSQLSESNFRKAVPDYNASPDLRVDAKKMKPYPGQHSVASKRLFAGKAQAVTIPANTPADESVRIALDTLFRHPNVGPFIGRQLIQRLVASNPSPAYVARVASVFNNNGRGVRGDMAAVVKAILLDSEALTPPLEGLGKLREPVLRVAHWMRSFGATSVSGRYMMTYELDNQSQRALYAPSVFGYFRPGFVPPNTSFSGGAVTLPEMQIVNESTSAQWVNTAFAMSSIGLGSNGVSRDVVANLQPLADMSANGQIDMLIERINLLLYAGRMSASLKQDILEAITSVDGIDTPSHFNRASLAMFLALASSEYLVQH